MKIEIRAISAFQDNYIWLLSNPTTGSATVVDPGAAEPVIRTLEKEGLTLENILITHHHADHTGGIPELASRYSPQIHGPGNPAIPGISKPVQEGDRFQLMGVQVEVIAVPGHTLDHIAFYLPDSDANPNQPVLFCGDTLFACGCGRLFEGTAAQMYASLQKLAALPAATAVYCAHEYTMANLQFAMAAEPDNPYLPEHHELLTQKLSKTGISLPSTIAAELRTNPFLRCHSEGIRKTLSTHNLETSSNGTDELMIFTALRQWKDNFRAAS
ncbi:MAG: hydroxyacylglutathione hydrolase [Pseudomonadales bacterium]|nr:hydroxyacylglutathione hydrolase [Pseudomonadales bacterium]